MNARVDPFDILGLPNRRCS